MQSAWDGLKLEVPRYHERSHSNWGGLRGINPTHVYIDELTEEGTMETLTTTGVPAFNAQLYIDKMCTQLGYKDADIAPIKEQLLACADQTSINKILFGIVPAPATLTPEDIQRIQMISRIDNSSEINQLRQDIIYKQGNITKYHNAIAVEAQKARELQRKMLSMKEYIEHDLMPEVEKILKGGWYKFRLVSQDYISFITPNITLEHINPDAGINITHNMGSYRVEYWPNRKRMYCMKNEGNTVVDRYYHPHVDSGGDICWGNAAAVASKAMMDIAPAKAFTALRTLLQTYNDNSAYKTLATFKAGSTALLADYGFSGNIWVENDEIPDEPHEEEIIERDDEYHVRDDDDDDGHYVEAILIRAYRMRGDAGPTYYFKTEDNIYKRIPTGAVL